MPTNPYAERYLRKKIEFFRKEKERPCADCGVQYPHYVMDFDHRPGEKKVFHIGRDSVSNHGLLAIKLEMMKCDVVCANCHRERTHQRQDGASITEEVDSICRQERKRMKRKKRVR